MRKTKLMLVILSLVIGIFFILPIKVSAIVPDGTADDWFNHISQFDYGIAYSEIYQVPRDFGGYRDFGLLIVEEPSHEVDGYIFEYSRYLGSDYWNYFEPGLMSVLKYEIIGKDSYADIERGLELEYGEDFDGYLYWNFEEKYWQIEPYDEDEPGYQEGYQEGYQSGYQDGFIAGEKSKLAKNNESFYNRIAIWIPAVITIVALTSIISIFGIKKKE